jgi:hypothetical protein
MFLALALAVAQQATLKLNPTVGKSYVYASRMELSQKVGGKDLGMAQTFTTTMKVLANAGGKVTIRTSITDLKIDLPPNSPMQANLQAMRKKMSVPTTTVLDSTGKLLSMNGKPASPQIAFLSGLGGGGTAPATVFTSKPIAAGQTWTTVFDLSKTESSGMKLSGKFPLTTTVKALQPGKVLLFSTLEGDMSVAALTNHVKSSGTTLIETATGMALDIDCVTSNVAHFGGREIGSTVKIAMKRK